MDIFGIYTKNQVKKKLIKIFQKISHFENGKSCLCAMYSFYFMIILVQNLFFQNG